jgi:transposase
MLLAHKIALDPNAAQRLYFARAAGIARFAWNWALAEWKAQYKAGGKPSDMSLRRDLNKVKRKQFPWVYDVSKCIVQEAIIDLGAAFRAFFEKRGRYPRFKRKEGRARFCAANEAGTFRTDGKRIKLPVIAWIRMREAVRFSGRLKRVTVSREGDRWFASIMIETDDVKPIDQHEPVVGVDLGVRTLAALSTGEFITGPKSHSVALKRLRRANKARSPANAGSQPTGASRRPVWLASMLALPTFAATQRTNLQPDCSCCCVVKTTLARSQQWFSCDGCGFKAPRDLNAALNLARLAASSVATACGEPCSGAGRKPRVKRGSAKQEENNALPEAE